MSPHPSVSTLCSGGIIRLPSFFLVLIQYTPPPCPWACTGKEQEGDVMWMYVNSISMMAVVLMRMSFGRSYTLRKPANAGSALFFIPIYNVVLVPAARGLIWHTPVSVLEYSIGLRKVPYKQYMRLETIGAWNFTITAVVAPLTTDPGDSESTLGDGYTMISNVSINTLCVVLPCTTVKVFILPIGNEGDKHLYLLPLLLLLFLLLPLTGVAST
jgi:hypothetical protein